jgi:tetratricopeptide (TPR) repeat protein
LLTKPRPEGESAKVPVGNPRRQAQVLLTAARQTGDQRRELMALTDLGIAFWRSQRFEDAVKTLSEALTLAQQLGERSIQGDVLGYLGMACRAVGDPRRGLECLEQAIICARECADRYAENIALQHLGDFHDAQEDFVRASAAYVDALALSRALGYRQHEAKLLWALAIQHAERGQPDQACAMAQATLDLSKELDNAYVEFLADRLRQFRADGLPASLRLPDETSAARFSASMSPNAGGAVPAVEAPAPNQATQEPSVAQLGLTATKALATFIGSGLKMVSEEVRQERLQICATCEHHTGMRCRLCSCFTSAKTRLPHQECPIQKWPAVQPK